MQEPPLLNSKDRQRSTIDRGFDLSSSATREANNIATDSSTQLLVAPGKTDDICDRCSALDFEEIFNNRSPSGTYVGILNQSQRQLSCGVCRLFDSVKLVCDVHVGDSEFALYIVIKYESASNVSDKVLLLQCCRCSSTTYTSVKGLFCIAIDGVEDGSYKIPVALVARQIKPSFVDFSLVQSWVADCAASHPGCNDRAQARGVPKDLRLIDCSARKVVKAPGDLSYAALSYVWGQADRDIQPLIDGRLPEALALTIEDAIVVTKQLGLDYLWIDRFCIEQSNEEDVYMQLNQMDLVYACAFITIVAAAGQDSSYGLPGVSSTPRSIKPSIQRGRHRLVTIPYNSDIVKRSVWEGRGWTMQERFFSSKSVFFTEEQVHYECRRSQAVETINGPMFPPSSKAIDPGRPSSISMAISAYCGRELSFDADAINALAGIFNHYGVQKNPVYHHIGIPVVSCFGVDWSNAIQSKGPERRDAALAESLVAGLCWRNEGTGRRRRMFPSWSWAGWTCKLSDYHPELNDGLLLDPDELPKVMWEDLQGRIRPFDRIPMQNGSSELIGKIIHLETWVVPLLLPQKGSIPPEYSSWRHTVMLENDAVCVQLPATFCQDPEPPVPDKQGSPKGEYLGLLLGKTNGKDDFMLIVRHSDQYFERIGYFHIQPDRQRALDRSTGKELSTQVMDLWDRENTVVNKIYREQRIRRRVRIG